MPIPLQKAFTYRVTEAEHGFILIGMRVAVPFGNRKIYTGIVLEKHDEEPQAYEARDIYQILDEQPVISALQLQHWQWLASYYLCSLGEVLRAAIPRPFLLESETLILLKEGFEGEAALDDEEFLIWEALQHRPKLSVQEVSGILDRKGVLAVIHRMIEKGAIEVREEIYEQYRPKMVRYLRLHEKFDREDQLHGLLDSLGRAEKQREAILAYFHLLGGKRKPLKVKEYSKRSGVTTGVLQALIKKGVFEIYEVREDRVSFDSETRGIHGLSEVQAEALEGIRSAFDEHGVCLLHGVTSSGKTEIYMHLIEEALERGKQVLYLLPEIALTTHIISRLEKYFGDRISVFHSRYSVQERVEVWNNLLHHKDKASVIIGARSSVLLPFSDLGLVIVDEEHDGSYKQFDPAPRYHARDAAIMLGNLHACKVLLGSATPALETYFNAEQNKYGLVVLSRRFGDVLLPDTELVDIKEQHRKKRMQGHFSERMLELIQEALKLKEQVILFQNRRGYSPVVECSSCGVSPQCPNCDVSLTYHRFSEELRCHYCGHSRRLPEVCPACGNPTLDTKGFGTEQIELELKQLFPNASVGRMDLDTTRGKHGYEKLLGAFNDREIDILVGTQMLTKGLDFQHVSLVGVMNADNQLNFPDFRAHERTFQLLVQVSGRAGRAQKRGRVAIQTFNPYHRILQQVTTNDYEGMYSDQLNERHQFHYPPYVRLIKVLVKHKDQATVEAASRWLGQALNQVFGENVLGPSSPAIARVRNKYIRTLLIKLSTEHSLRRSKDRILRVRNSFQSIPDFRSVQLILDVDNY